MDEIYQEMKIKTESMYAIQNLRIQAELRVKSFTRDGKLSKSKAKSLHGWVDERLERMEEEIKKEISVIVKDIPIYQAFFKDVKGIGPALSGSLIAGIGTIERFANVSKLWKYCGMDVNGDGEARKLKRGEKVTWNPFLRTTCYKIGESFVKQDGDDEDGSEFRRLFEEKRDFYKKKFPQWNICVDCGGGPRVEPLLQPVRKAAKHIKDGTLPDRDDKKQTKVCLAYDHLAQTKTMDEIIGMLKTPTVGYCAKCRKTQFGEAHPVKKTKDGKPIYRYTLGHIHAMARRFSVKIFLEHLWVEWRKLEGLDITKPWIIAIGGHSQYISH